MVAFPPTAPQSLQNTISSYVYQEYSDDDDIQAFAAAYNGMVQTYVDWFNTINLPVYTGAQISGSLLDWIATGLYGLPRPVIPGSSAPAIGLLATYFLAQLELAQYKTFPAQTVYPVNDDIYKRVLTWLLYKGDGFQFTTRWLKRRIMRFLVGVDGVGYVGGTHARGGLILPANLVDNRATQGTYVNMAGTLGIAPINTPRVDWSQGSGQFLDEVASTNYITNPMAINAVVGTGGSGAALPTDWSWPTTPPLTWQLIQSITVNGVGYVDIRLYGTPTATQLVLQMENSLLSVAAGESVTFSVYGALVGGTRANVVGVYPNLRFTTFSPLGPDLSLFPTPARLSVQDIAPNVDSGYGGILFLFGNTTTAVDITMRIGGAQLEAQNEATSLILPPTGTTAVSNRAADIVCYPTQIDNTYPVSVTFSGRQVNIAITGFASIKPLFTAAVASGVLPLPPQFTYVVS
jgi:hypothetical protein